MKSIISYTRMGEWELLNSSVRWRLASRRIGREDENC
jgi:hypothetical protein